MAAFFLRQNGLQVIGVHFMTGFEAATRSTSKTVIDSELPVHQIGRQLGIPIKVIDIRSEFETEVVDYFCRTYQKGQTPNPCMRCNSNIKFGSLYKFANTLGAQRLATGHYARVKIDRYGNHRLFKGLDRQKDQSYFLARLNRQQLATARFPLGERKKSEIKELAAQNGLHPVARGESQDVCFIKDESYAEFIAKHTGLVPQPGLIENKKGKVIGEHQGLHLFTIGQRRGINCPAAEPYYVLRLDCDRNRLIVGTKADLLCGECRVTHINWICDRPVEPTELNTRVRYRSSEVASTVIPLDAKSAMVRFKNPQSAITPGQGAVFYRGDEVLGGGWISPKG